jgi:hypothetical protein
MKKSQLLRLRQEMTNLRTTLEQSRLCQDEANNNLILTSDPWFSGEGEENQNSLAFLALNGFEDQEVVVSLDEVADALPNKFKPQYVLGFEQNDNALNIKHRKEKLFREQIAIIGNVNVRGSIVPTEVITVRFYRGTGYDWTCCVWIYAEGVSARGSAKLGIKDQAALKALEMCGVKLDEKTYRRGGVLISVLEELCEFLGAEHLFTSKAHG